MVELTKEYLIKELQGAAMAIIKATIKVAGSNKRILRVDELEEAKGYIILAEESLKECKELITKELTE
jgi:hypothetical protein